MRVVGRAATIEELETELKVFPVNRSSKLKTPVPNGRIPFHAVALVSFVVPSAFPR